MSSRLRPLIAWLIILACTAFIIYGSRDNDRHAESQRLLPSPQFVLQARYMLGFHTLLSSIPNRAANQDASLLQALNQFAKTSAERLQVTTIIAEVRGNDAALEHLESINSEMTDPQLRQDAELFRMVYNGSPERLSAHDRQLLIEHHQFFARLLLTRGKPATDPDRANILTSAKRTAIAAGLIFVIAGAGLLAGFGLFIAAIVLFSTGKLRRRYLITRNASVVFLECFALYFVGMIAISLLFHRVLGQQALWPSALFLLLPIIFLYPASRIGAGSTARILGFIPTASPKARPALISILREMIAGVAGYIAGLPLFFLGIILTLFLSRFAQAQPTHPIINYAGRSWRVTLQLYLLACLVAPMVEETFFRGTLYAYLRPRTGYFLSALISSVIFAAIHPQGWTTLPVLTAIGFTLATIREWRQTVLAPMTAHALNNFVATTFLTLALS
ncbi:MAG TPA: CPBP family intramembrane glutamic endopeptidase [Tepidisphaeraceae bacterium]|jgi:membrane protease YdiL (CAAX protease family)